MGYELAMKVRRTELKMTAQDLAKKIDVSENTIFAYESEVNKRQPNMKRMKDIADALDTTVEKLFYQKEGN